MRSTLKVEMGEVGVGPLAGAPAWIISDGKAGHEALARGVAEALGASVTIKLVAPSGLWKALAPWGPVAPAERFGDADSDFAPPWPRIAFAAGRTTTPYIRTLKRKAGLATYTVILMDSRTGPSTADLFWIPEHDRRRGPNVVTTLTAPHPFTAARLDSLRRSPDPAVAALPAPRVAVLVGGPNDRYRYTPAVNARLATLVRSMADLGAGLMLTVSRRTPKELVDALDMAVESASAIFFKGEGPNPYPQFLANADAFVVTADSINMVGEAAATGKPIFVFEPEGGAPKFSAFHAALRAKGVTRPAPDRLTALDGWTYAPLHAAETIAAEIVRRLERRRATIGN